MRGRAPSAAQTWRQLAVQPTIAPGAPTIYRLAEVEANPVELNSRLGLYTNFVNLLDLAAITVPAGFRPDGLPFGVTFVGPAFADRALAAEGGNGSRIEVEVWEMPVRGFGAFVAEIPRPLGIGTLQLDDGEQVKGFLCEAYAVDGRPDITHYGGWRGYAHSRGRGVD